MWEAPAVATTETFDVTAIRARFPALGRPGPNGTPYVWADAPGGSQMVDTAIDAVAARMRTGAGAARRRPGGGRAGGGVGGGGGAGGGGPRGGGGGALVGSAALLSRSCS